MQLTMATAVPLLVVWAIRIWRWRLASRYPVLLAYLSLSALMWAAGFIVLATRGMGEAYRWLFVAYRVVDWSLSVAILLEVFGHAVKVSPAIASAGRWFANLALAVALLTGVGLAAGTAMGEVFQFRSWHEVEEAYYVGILIGSILMLAFLVIFRVREARNVLVVGGVFGFQFALGALLWRFQSGLGETAGLVSAALYLSTILIGVVMFRRDGEIRPDQDVPDDLRESSAELMRTLRSTTRSLEADAVKGLDAPPDPPEDPEASDEEDSSVHIEQKTGKL